MFDFFDHPNKTCDLDFYQQIVFLYDDEESREEEDWLNGTATWLTFVRQGFISSDIKNHYSKTKFLKGIQVYPQCFIGVVIDKGGKVAQGFLNTLEKNKFLGRWHSELCLGGIGSMLLAAYWGVTE